MLWGEDKELRKGVFQGFQQVKQDVGSLTIELDRQADELIQLKKEVKNLKTSEENNTKSELDRQSSESQPSLSLSDLRILIKEVVKETIEEALKQPNTKAAELFSTETPEPPTENIPIPTPIKTKKDKLKEDLLKSYERNRKDIIKQQIVAEATKGTFTKIQLRDIVVDQKKYCSKASFYRYMEELEMEGFINYQRKKQKSIITTLNAP